MENYQIAILGAGSMGGAILSGLIASSIPPKNVRVSTKTILSSELLASNFQVRTFSLESDPLANVKAAQGADVVIVAVKPNYVLEVLGEISSELKPGSLVISVAAGITTESMEKVAGDSSVIRAMPNTPSILGLGVTGVAAGSKSTSEQMDLARELFETVGEVLVVSEEKINALSTISGSGPAYIFYFAEKLIAAALNMGFSQEEAELMVKGTFLGSAALLSESAEPPQELRRQVTSPNGTTMQAIGVFDQANLGEIFSKATEAALARAIELGRVKP